MRLIFWVNVSFWAVVLPVMLVGGVRVGVRSAARAAAVPAAVVDAGAGDGGLIDTASFLPDVFGWDVVCYSPGGMVAPPAKAKRPPGCAVLLDDAYCDGLCRMYARRHGLKPKDESAGLAVSVCWACWCDLQDRHRRSVEVTIRAPARRSCP